MRKNQILILCVVVLLGSMVPFAHAQEAVDVEREYHFNGNLSVTNNGFSLIPTFSLGKPALISTFSLGGARFSLDPQFRFDLAGLKPWSFIFIWRYKVVRSDKFLLMAGLHLPAISFKEMSVVISGETVDRTIPSRFFTPELTASYKLSEKIGVGGYYLYGLGLEKEFQSRHTHFISIRASFSRLSLGKEFYFSWNPQVYFLTMDGVNGYFTAQSFELGHRNFPVSLSSLMNFKLKSHIQVPDFDWNIGLVYSFGTQLVKK